MFKGTLLPPGICGAQAERELVSLDAKKITCPFCRERAQTRVRRRDEPHLEDKRRPDAKKGPHRPLARCLPPRRIGTFIDDRIPHDPYHMPSSRGGPKLAREYLHQLIAHFQAAAQ
jgi:hypothetical protein